MPPLVGRCARPRMSPTCYVLYTLAMSAPHLQSVASLLASAESRQKISHAPSFIAQIFRRRVHISDLFSYTKPPFYTGTRTKAGVVRWEP